MCFYQVFVIEFAQIAADPKNFRAARNIGAKIGGPVVIARNNAVIFFLNELIEVQGMSKQVVIVVQRLLFIKVFRSIVDQSVQYLNIAVKNGIIGVLK